MELKREAVLLAGYCNVNRAQKPCSVKRRLAYFKRLALAASPITPRRSQRLYARLEQRSRQADDDTLRNMAVRIQARAIRRCGELLKAIESATGAHLKSDGGDTFSRTQAARDAGLSERQQVTAVRVANVPSEDFETLVESDAPPTLTKLAEIGTQPKPLWCRLNKI